ncbi:hypothetical protein [Dongia sp.]|uniref:hypothetical protein n=1 Tax=Dongia sp. TaxID=1977262 RepID=UPI003750BE4E
MDNYETIYPYIVAEEAAYKTVAVPIADGYDWNMYEHIRKSVLYKNGMFAKGKNDDTRPFKNITRPILNLQYRTEGFDVKDIVLFVNDPDAYYLSFLIKKYHEKWARDNDIDTFIDDMVESYVDFGGALIKDVNDKKPEVVELQSIAFCDQTNLLGGPLGIKHNFSPSDLLDMADQHWGDENYGATVTLERLIELAMTGKSDPQNQKGEETKTPGKYIEAYEVHGSLPTKWLKAVPEGSTVKKYTPQLQVVAFYHDEKGEKQWVTLFKGKETTSPFKKVIRHKIFGRALGMGGAEELFTPQTFTNLREIQMTDMLEAASKIVHVTDDETFATQNKLSDIENNEILKITPERTVRQLNTQPVNLPAFEKASNEWETHAKLIGGAAEVLLGESPTSGTPFKLQDLVVSEAHSLHDYRKGQLATFTDTIYRDWVIPNLARDIAQGSKFLAELALDELQAVADSLVAVKAHDLIKEEILAGRNPYPADIETYKQKVRDEFMKGGNKRFIEIFKDEMKGLPLDVYTNIAGKQKDLNKITDKLVNVFRQMLATYNPQTGSFAIFDDPRMSKLFNEIIEYSGLSPIDFYAKAEKKQPTELPTPSQSKPQAEAPIAA